MSEVPLYGGIVSSASALATSNGTEWAAYPSSGASGSGAGGGSWCTGAGGVTGAAAIVGACSTCEGGGGSVRCRANMAHIRPGQIQLCPSRSGHGIISFKEGSLVQMKRPSTSQRIL